MPFFQNATNVDARGGTYNYITGDQVNHHHNAGNSLPPHRGPKISVYDDRPSYTPGYSDPPSWTPRHTDPPSWSNRSQTAFRSPSSSASMNYQEPDTYTSKGPGQRMLQQSAMSSRRSTIPMPPSAHQSRQKTGKTYSLNSSFDSFDSFDSDDSLMHVDQPSEQVASLNKALISFETEVSPWKEPSKWIEADEENIESIVQNAVNLLANEEIRDARFAGQVMIYPRLIVYIFIHLTCSPDNESLLDVLKGSLQQWKTWDGITIIQNHQVIKDYLWRICQQGLPLDLRSSFLSDFQKLLELGAIRLCAHLAVMVMDRTQYKEFINRQGKGAQVLVNLLQARLDFPIEPEFKSRHVKTLIKMCRASGFYPECLILNGIEIKGDSIAAGSFGEVYKAEIRMARSGQKKDIAIKILKVYQNSDAKKITKSFVTEAVTWKQLSHANVLPIYGIYHLDDRRTRLCFACPWMENGNIKKFLSQPENSNLDCVPLALDIAQGLAYLHSQRIVHGDLKGLNILVSNSGRALLADFGLATMEMDATSMMTLETHRGTGTLRWQAPELFGDFLNVDTDDNPPHNTPATDVYAFACVCYEMFTGNIPFADTVKEFQVIGLVVGGKRPLQPKDELSSSRGLNDIIWRLIEECWSQKWADRPTADQIVGYLRAMPNRPTDRRPVDKFDFPSEFWGNQAKHPFSVLAYSTYINMLDTSGTVTGWDSDSED